LRSFDFRVSMWTPSGVVANRGLAAHENAPLGSLGRNVRKILSFGEPGITSR
jgi:hypothetical protein